MNKRRAILWFRHDLRWHDNEAIQAVSRNADEIIPVYIFDERLFFGWQRGPYPRIFRTRLQFIIESIRDLRQNLRNRGSELYIRIGKTEDILFNLADRYGSAGVFCNRERMPWEVRTQDALELKLWSIGQELYYFRGKMLFHTADLPFPIARMPDLFSTFRKEMDQIVSVRQPIDMSEVELPLPDTDLDPGDIPGLGDFGYDTEYENPVFHGGETAGMAWTEKKLAEVAEGYSGPLMISPWLSNGNISSKWVYHKINGLPDSAEEIKNNLRRNLILRDYYRLIGKRSPEALFREGGFRDDSSEVGTWDDSAVLSWMRGETGEEIVDAAMHCLFFTGYIDHQKRKAVAQYLLEEMGLHWQLGAGYFESVSLDYDPCSNYGNWQRQAGISPDLKSRHSVNLETLADQVDATGEFRDRWAQKELDFDFAYRKQNNSLQVT